MAIVQSHNGDGTLRARIVGTGAYAPEKILSNQELERMVDTSDEWIVERTGIRERRVVSDGEASSDLAIEAGRRALDMAGIAAGDLDLIIVGTVTPDMFTPSCACVVQQGLGARRATAFDLSAACPAWIYGLSIADSFIRTGACRNALIIGVEVLSKFLNFQDRSTCILFGDGAGASVLVPGTGPGGILSTHLYSDGEGGKFITIPGGGSRNPASEHTLAERKHFVHMDGREVYRFAVRSLKESALEALKANNLTPEDIDLFIPHQANGRIIESTALGLRMPPEKVFLNLERYGNTSSASIPIALDEAVREGRVKEGELILMASFGAGFTWASSIVRW